jgi:hypothetical protein
MIRRVAGLEVPMTAASGKPAAGAGGSTLCGCGPATPTQGDGSPVR